MTAGDPALTSRVRLLMLCESAVNCFDGFGERLGVVQQKGKVWGTSEGTWHGLPDRNEGCCAGNASNVLLSDIEMTVAGGGHRKSS